MFDLVYTEAYSYVSYFSHAEFITYFFTFFKISSLSYPNYYRVFDLLNTMEEFVKVLNSWEHNV
ncbi:hypothetical protein RvY_16417 [Ramazzottius varieornatus]|uniref:Uncharacterized protein n=1 Tax=Ramazzottius varieornatus TaxID=947166 RepID=A0A1D1W2P7_RAMVA|nr:hypothetical protein RvY_16417 [Ramazzottius varieornatus]